jgi:hypothetical protein
VLPPKRAVNDWSNAGLAVKAAMIWFAVKVWAPAIETVALKAKATTAKPTNNFLILINCNN